MATVAGKITIFHRRYIFTQVFVHDLVSFWGRSYPPHTIALEVKDYFKNTPPKTNMDTQNHSLEKVLPALNMSHLKGINSFDFLGGPRSFPWCKTFHRLSNRVLRSKAAQSTQEDFALVKQLIYPVVGSTSFKKNILHVAIYKWDHFPFVGGRI